MGSELLSSFGKFNCKCQNKNRKAPFVFCVLSDSITDKIHVVTLDNMKEIKNCWKEWITFWYTHEQQNILKLYWELKNRPHSLMLRDKSWLQVYQVA